ncbi:MAG: sigma-54-dependent Fis family transcriptional regulator [Gammaproteobacteria bacterium]|nr:MAG: sigma-54-dependent Fis family transcriptional regulator [Gammaproteobacteria bacterium]
MKDRGDRELRASLGGRSILVIDDSEAVRTALEVLLSLHGARVSGAGSPAAGLDLLASEPVDLVIQDMNFRREATSGEEGIALFHHIRSIHPDLPVILLTAWTHLETAVELVRAGAADYVGKPWDNDRLLTTVRNLLDLQAARAENRELRRRRAAARLELAARYELGGLVCESEAMHALVATAVRVAPAEVPVLISGPNGAGKEVIADLIQANSSVRGRPYLKVNLGALPDELMEAELFGTESGAFTGARARAGRFEAADGGTLFLDELGNLSLQGQARLLRVLQTGEFERLGSSQTRRTRVRVIAATNAKLPEMIRAGRFREDLFYRLNVIELEVPPLATRQDDILPLASRFLQPGFTLAPDAAQALLRHAWPGNVRELCNVVQRACLLAPDSVITTRELGLPVVPVPADGANLDRATLEQALHLADGVVARAARDLGLSRQALYRRMEKLGLKLPAEGGQADAGSD